jgi:hypothetical protein
VGGDVCDYRRLAGSVCGMARRTAYIPGGCHRVTACRACLEHLDLAAHP